MEEKQRLLESLIIWTAWVLDSHILVSDKHGLCDASNYSRIKKGLSEKPGRLLSSAQMLLVGDMAEEKESYNFLIWNGLSLVPEVAPLQIVQMKDIACTFQMRGVCCPYHHRALCIRGTSGS